MRSKGGKIFYRCEECYSADIKKEVGHPVAFHEGKTENLYKCNTCNCMGYWKNRIKESVMLHYQSISNARVYYGKHSATIVINGQTLEIKNVGRFK